MSSPGNLSMSHWAFIYGMTTTTTQEQLNSLGNLTELLFTLPPTPIMVATTPSGIINTTLSAPHVNGSGAKFAVTDSNDIDTFFARFPSPPYSVHLAVGIVMTMVGIVAVLGNLFIIYIFIRFRSLRTPGNVFVPNLALADGMMALTGFPLYAAASFKGRWVFGRHVCSLYGMFGAAFGLMSINTLAAIAFERYMVIVKCQAVGQKSSRRHVSILLIVVWVNSFSWAIAPVLGWNRYQLEGFGTTCSFDYITRTPSYQSLVMTMFFGGFILPLFLIIYCYVYIIAYVRGSEKDLADKTSSMDSQMWQGARLLYRRTELRIARTVILTVIFFCLSWLPYSAIALIGQFGNQELITPVTSALPGIMAKMSTMYNPFIYSFSHPKIKQKLWLLIQSYFPNSGPVLGQSDMTQKEHRLSVFKAPIERYTTTNNCCPSTQRGASKKSKSVTGSSSSNSANLNRHEACFEAQTMQTNGSGDIVYILPKRMPRGSSTSTSHSSSSSSGSRENRSCSGNENSSHRSFHTCQSEESQRSASQHVCVCSRNNSSKNRRHTTVRNVDRFSSTSGGSTSHSPAEPV